MASIQSLPLAGESDGGDVLGTTLEKIQSGPCLQEGCCLPSRPRNQEDHHVPVLAPEDLHQRHARLHLARHQVEPGRVLRAKPVLHQVANLGRQSDGDD